MDTFVCSSWYFLRYADPRNNERFASEEKLKAWLPIDLYIGGAEHAVMHLLYFRFFTKVLNKLGYLDFDEPALRLYHQGIILGPDGQKMSKSRGNVIDPDKEVKKYGADVVRMYLCFMGPYDQGGAWNPQGCKGIARFLEKIRDYFSFIITLQRKEGRVLSSQKETKMFLHKTIKKVTEDIKSFKFNTAISAMMELLNFLRKKEGSYPYRILEKEELKKFLLILSPFAPHLTEELWQRLKENPPLLEKFKIEDSIHSQRWPKYDPKLIKEEKIEFIIQINGKVRDKVKVDVDISEKEATELSLKREKIKKWIEGKKIKRIIFVPKKLINIVI